jgi:hypothetical protein
MVVPNGLTSAGVSLLILLRTETDLVSNILLLDCQAMDSASKLSNPGYNMPLEFTKHKFHFWQSKIEIKIKQELKYVLLNNNVAYI